MDAKEGCHGKSCVSYHIAGCGDCHGPGWSEGTTFARSHVRLRCGPVEKALSHCHQEGSRQEKEGEGVHYRDADAYRNLCARAAGDSPATR